MKEDSKIVPSRTILKLLSWFCPDPLYEEIEGDLIQKFNREVRVMGERKAKRRLMWNAIRFLRPGILLRNKFSLESNFIAMIFNYFKMAGRHLMRDKAFSIINILGLSAGIVAFFMIVQYADFETSYEHFHDNRKEIYRVALKRYEHGELVNSSAKSYAGVYDLLTRNFPEVTAASRMMKIPANTGILFKYNGKIYNEAGGMINVDTTFFNVFPSLLIRGDAATVLAKPHSIVISESVAKKIFGEADPIGQQIDQMDADLGSPNTITGVIRDLPDNSHFHARFICRLDENWPDMKSWGSSFPFNYVSVSGKADVAAVTEKLNGLMKKVEKDFPATKGTKLFLQPIKDIHLTSQLNDEYELNGNQKLLYVVLAIALVIIVVAWINYVNIEIARFLKRSKEVGVRRVIGSGKFTIALQFLIEYGCLSFVALLIAMVVFIFVTPQLSTFTGITLHSIQWPLSPIVVKMSAFFMIGSVIVGLYPALFLLKLNPVATLKGNLGGVNRGKGIRRSLMIIQFAASLFLIAFLFLVDHQLDFMRSANKKIEVDKVITVLNPTAYEEKDVKQKHNDFQLLEQKLLQHPSVQMLSTSSAIPGAEIGFTFVDLIKRKRDDPYDPTRYKTLFVGENFIPLYGLRLLAGRNFDVSGEDWAEPWQRRDWHKIILNEKAIHQLGYSSPQKAVNQIVKYHLWGDDFEDYEIIGVIEDYHHEAVKEEVFPMILAITYNSFQQVYYSIRLNKGSHPQEAITHIQQSWKEVFPDLPFDYFFLDDYYDRQFKSELQFERIFILFAGVALFLSCLGVLGTSLFEVNTRLKEISIRKVLGASAKSLIALLSRDTILMAVASFIIAAPLIYYAGNQWLSDYPLRIDFDYVFFLVPIGLLILIVLITSSFQIIKAANSNPVDHLKNE